MNESTFQGSSEPSEAEPAESPNAASSPSEVVRPSRATVLVADPEAQALRALSLILRMDQYDVRVASTAGDALDVLSASAPDVVLVDRDMTGAEGVALAYLVRRIDRTVPIIITSARPGDLAPPIDRSYRFSKPVDAQRLRDQIAELAAARSRGH